MAPISLRLIIGVATISLILERSINVTKAHYTLGEIKTVHNSRRKRFERRKFNDNSRTETPSNVCKEDLFNLSKEFDPPVLPLHFPISKVKILSIL
jgi:hypothetical protein